MLNLIASWLHGAPVAPVDAANVAAACLALAAVVLLTRAARPDA